MTTARAYLEEARSECLRYARNLSFMLPLVLMPSVFYLLFGVWLGQANGAGAARYLLASYGVFGVMGPGLFGFGVSLALERDGGLLTFKRALPMPPGAYLAGKMVMAMATSALVALSMLSLALAVAKVPLDAAQVSAFVATCVLGVLPFCALGLWIGTLIKGEGAPGMLQLVYLPMAFLSGLWMPLSMLPGVLQAIAPSWPSYHLNAIALDAVGAQPADTWPHAMALAGFTLAFLGLAARRLRRNG